MTDYKYRTKKRRAEEKQRDRQQRQEIRAIAHPPKPKMETSKKMAIYINVICTVVILYSLVAMWYFRDISYLNTLIPAVAAEGVNYGTYCAKAYFAKKNAEELKYLRENTVPEDEPIQEEETI